MILCLELCNRADHYPSKLKKFSSLSFNMEIRYLDISKNIDSILSAMKYAI